LQYRFTNHDREYWYIGSIPARSAIQKNKIAEYSAIEVYSKRFSLIFLDVSSAPACFNVISLAKVFEELRAFTAVSSSSKFPLEVDKTSSILSSISLSCLRKRKQA